MWTQFRNDGNMPMQYVASTVTNRTGKLPRCFAKSYMDLASAKLPTSGRLYGCTLTERGKLCKCRFVSKEVCLFGPLSSRSLRARTRTD